MRSGPVSPQAETSFERVFGRFFLDGYLPFLWIALLAVLLYTRTLSFGYTYLDDNLLISGNREFLSDPSKIPTAFLQKVFPGSFLPYYRPVLIISFIADTVLGKGAPVMYHLTNVAIHACASSLVFLFLLRLGYDRWQSFAGGAVYAVHPALAQAVAWIPGRNDSLLAVFVLASFISFVDFVRVRSWRRYAAHIIFFALALYTKESALVIVPLCVLYLHIIEREGILSANEKALLPGWMIALALWYWTRSIALAGPGEVTIFDIGTLVVVYMPAAVQFIGKIFFPFNLSVFPVIEDTTFAYGAAALLLLSAAVAFTRNKRYGFMVFAFAWAALFILPSLIRANYRISADFLEHRVYVAVVGFMILVFETEPVKRLCRNRKAFAAAAIAVVMLFSAINAGYSGAFAGRDSFWANAVKHSPHSPFAHLARGMGYYDAGALDEAEREYRACLALDPLKAGAMYHLGKVYFRKGGLEEAERQYRKALAIYPYYDGAYLELGIACYRQRKAGAAAEAWKKAARLNPGDVNAHKFLAILYYEEKDYAGSMRHVRRLQAMGSDVPDGFLESLESALGSNTASARAGGD
jgi:tetratricopeptide (TPR) repeat protein